MEVILLRHPSTHHLFTHPIIAGISVVALCSHGGINRDTKERLSSKPLALSENAHLVYV